MVGSDIYRQAVMLQKLLEDAGVENVTIKDIDRYKKYSPERHDDEIKLFVGAKPNTINIFMQEWYPGG